MALPLSYRGMGMLPARQQGGHQEGSHLSLTWVVFPILFSLGDVSTDVANPLSGISDSNRRHSAWKADVLPLNYTRKVGGEPPTLPSHGQEYHKRNLKFRQAYRRT